jgi:hypothetical protein
MFDSGFSSIEVSLPPVISTRDGWHAVPDLVVQDDRLRGLDPSSLSADEALSALVALQAHRSRIDAMEVDLLVRSAGAARVVRDVLVDDDNATGGSAAAGTGRVLHLVDEVVDEIACALHRSHQQMQGQVQHARLLHGPLARTRAALAAGSITLAHASAVAQQASRLAAGPLGSDPDADLVLALACDRLQDRVLPYAGAETPSQCRSRARRAVVAIDAAGEAARRRRARRGCDVSAYGIDDGLAIIEARLPLAQAARVIATVDDRARALAADGTTTDPAWLQLHGLDPDATLGQLRAAAFADLFTAAHAPANGLGVEVQVLIDAATLVGLDPDGSAWLQVGSGAAEAMGREDLLRLLADPDAHPTLRRLVTDPPTGALIDRGAHRYPISGSLAAWITARDVTCRFPGCTRRAARCDVDHAEDFTDGGPTTVANTGALCRRHHNRKTHAGWQITDSRPDGSCTFTSPAGRRYRHSPVDLPPAPQPPPPPTPPPPDEVLPPF